MGLLGDNILGSIFSAADSLKRKVKGTVKGLLDDPAAYMEQAGDIYADNWKKVATDPLNNLGPDMIGIVSPAIAKTLSIAKHLPDDDIFRAAVANTKGASITEDGLQMALQRNQVPDQAMRPSVRGGVFYLPEGAAQGKHYSTGKNGYGGTEKITGETLIQNPMFAKGVTGGKAPESAYDSMLGKGSYESMRTDALKVFGGYNAKEADKVDLAKSFLSKYAPELVNQAENIVRNSKQGNQLAYALQEAAVGSAVRNAGHDAVVGYSKGKSGPFLSEVFDVRESHYPDKFGSSTVWPSLLNP